MIRQLIAIISIEKSYFFKIAIKDALLHIIDIN